VGLKSNGQPSLFDIAGQTAVVTGGGGALCSAMAKALAQAGARVAVLDLCAEAAERVAAEIRDCGGQADSLACNVLDRGALENAATAALAAFGPVDILINGAGGNRPLATTSAERPLFDLDCGAVEQVFDLNFLGTLQCCQVFGRGMAERGQGCIVNIASMSSLRPLTRIPAYSAAKAAVANFTQWLAVHMANEYDPRIRVNALAPGFFITEQNRYLLLEASSGELTERGRKIVEHTPAGRFGLPEDLLGALLWLVSPAAAFVTGVVLPVDGGFSACSGV
jgi:NAD(P)-dependent dehydrogenase (short-subunit alcohol dehydrogenase family)